MADELEPQKKKVQSSHAAEEIRVNEFAELSRSNDGEDRRVSHLGPYRRPESLPKGIVWGVAGLIVLFVAGFGISYYVIRHDVASAVLARANALKAGVQDLQNFDLQSASKDFSSANNASFSSASGILSVFGSFFSGSSDALRAFGDLSGRFSELTNNLVNMQSDVWGVVAGAKITGGTDLVGAVGGASSSSALVADLNGLRATLAAINEDTNRLSEFTSAMGKANGTNENYFTLIAQVQSAKKFLDAFVPWFSDTTAAHHILVLLENPSEMRPAGGFLGSYADVTIRNGAIEGISVHDIADVDASFTQKIVPPKPLQLEGTGWRPADGNWFFDFPKSASATIALFERSSLYSNTSTTFDGAIAIAPQVMSDLLLVTGPITVPNAAIGVSPANGSTTFSSDALVGQIQGIVQAGQAKSSASTYPKKVLGALWSSVLAKLASSTDAEKQRMYGFVADWAANKDAMAFFKDPDFENFVRAYGAGGDEFVPPQNFNGDYLAIVHTDVNSDKSELYVSSTVGFNMTIGSDGTATDHLTVTRTHNGEASPSWWYRTTSQDYMQIIVPIGSSVTNESGGFVKNVRAPVNYAAQGYGIDPLLAALEASTKQNFAYPAVSVRPGGDADNGKTVFSVWSRTYMGSSTQVAFDYTHPLFAIPANGVQYQFVFERQSGAVAKYTFEIDAPLGYNFAENNLPSYIYKENTMPGRLAVTLTLKKL